MSGSDKGTMLLYNILLLTHACMCITKLGLEEIPLYPMPNETTCDSKRSIQPRTSPEKSNTAVFLQKLELIRTDSEVSRKPSWNRRSNTFSSPTGCPYSLKEFEESNLIESS